MQITDWTDLGLFASVARAGALAGAERETGLSQATLSRRMTALEQRTGRRLFMHGARGYTPTHDGRALLERTKKMEAAARDITHWSAAVAGPPRVRISAGTWTSHRLARTLPDYWSPRAVWTPEFVTNNRDLDIERREVDIGVRNRRPTHAWLAGRRTGVIEYAAYAFSQDVTGWIGPSDTTASAPSEAWVLAHHGAEIMAVSDDPHTRLALAQSGVGRAIFPTFAGDYASNLMRVSDVIDTLTSEEWLVCHQDTRTEPAIRAALDALALGLRDPLRDGAQTPILKAP